MRYAYNTNGTANHRLEDVVDLLADCGYDGVALTLDHAHLDPFAPELGRRSDELARRLSRLGLGSVVETGARFLLDPRAKHEPTLVSPMAEGRARRVDFLGRAVDVAGALGSEAVSFWAGVASPEVDAGDAWRWLGEGVRAVVERAERAGVTVALEPEPGMVVETADDHARLVAEANLPGLALALDVGHCLVTGDRDPAEAVRELAPVLGTVALEDMRRGVHEHLAFGEGELDLPSVLRALADVGFEGLVCIELSRDSYRADHLIPSTLASLRAAGG